MIWPVACTTVPMLVGSVAWVIVALKRLRVSNERTQQALTGCPAANRAAVLKAAGEFTRALGDPRFKPAFMPSISQQRPKADDGATV